MQCRSLSGRSQHSALWLWSYVEQIYITNTRLENAELIHNFRSCIHPCGGTGVGSCLTVHWWFLTLSKAGYCIYLLSKTPGTYIMTVFGSLSLPSTIFILILVFWYWMARETVYDRERPPGGHGCQRTIISYHIWRWISPTGRCGWITDRYNRPTLPRSCRASTEDVSQPIFEAKAESFQWRRAIFNLVLWRLR